MKNGNRRSLLFESNKVNVITGDSETGKSSILSIIDYCFLASKAKIPEVKINENVDWYGVKFSINERMYTIARGALSSTGNVSDSFYFSSTGEVPTKPRITLKEKELKNLLNIEFHIDDNVVIPYGGKKIKQGDKVSLKYFMMFNYQDEDTIDDSNEFFVKQNDDKYREALHRVFDLAIGISSVEDVVIQDKINSLETDLRRYIRKDAAISKEGQRFEDEIWELVRSAKTYELIDNNTETLEQAITNLNTIAFESDSIVSNSRDEQLDNLLRKRAKLNIKIKKYAEFEKEYCAYKTNIKGDIDSLEPIEFIVNNYYDVIESPVVREFLSNLSDELKLISRYASQKNPIDFNVKSEIRALKTEIKKINEDIRKHRSDVKSFKSDYERIMFLGEIKGKMSIYQQEEVKEDYSTKIRNTEDEIELLDSKLENRDLIKSGTIKLLENLTKYYLHESREAMGTYGEYLTVFDYKNKALKLQKQDSVDILNVVGSSSNYMFLHLCLSLGLHELILKRDVPYIPSFLVLDQPSRPYYDNNNKKATDKDKITIAMKLLNDFINRINEKYTRDYQLIVIEKIPKEIWENAKLQNFHLVAEFYEEEKLIRAEDMTH